MKACRRRRDVRVVVVAVAALLASVALAGCFDPHRVQVPASVLEASSLEWNVTKKPQEGKQFGTKSMETRYVYVPEDAGPPYPGVLQVFSLRGDGADSRSELASLARNVIQQAIQREGIQVDSSQDVQGSRQLENGKTTDWFGHTGRIESARDDSIFLPGDAEHLVVRVHGEVGYDGRSKTGFIAVAFVQIGTHTGPALPGLPATEETNEQTWYEVVADSDGNVGGASLPTGRGLITNLRTHG